jgi:hypothetical protein
MIKSEKSAICRILFDLIQADLIIDSGEMEHYSTLRDKYSINSDDEITASQITFAEAVNSLSFSDSATKESLLQDFSNMTLSDGFCARSEALLMLALKSKLNAEDSDIQLISIPKPVFNVESASILYIESRYEKSLNETIGHNYRTIFKECQIAGFNFIYIPKVIEHYKQSEIELTTKIIHFLAPKFSDDGVRAIIDGLFSMSTSSFCKDILCNKLGITALRETPPSLLIKVGQSYVGESVYSNYLRIEIDETVISTLQNMLDIFLSMLSSDIISVHMAEEKHNQFLYYGFYKQLLEIFLIRRNIRSRVFIQPYTEEFVFPDIDEKLSKLHRREKALYLLLLIMSSEGGINFNQPKMAKELSHYDQKMQRIQNKYQLIYKYLGGEKAPDLRQPEIRRPIISCLKKSLSNLENVLYNFQDYTITKDEYGTLKIDLEPEVQYLYEAHSGYVQLSKTELYAKVKKI